MWLWPGSRREDLLGDQRVLLDRRELGARSARAGLSRMRLEIASLPRSCSSAARRRSRNCGLVGAERARQADHDQADAVGVPVGPGRLRVDDARRTRSAIRSSCPSSAVIERSSGSHAPMSRASSESQKSVSSASVPSASTSAGSNQPPRRRRATRQAAPRRPPRGRSRPSGRGRGSARAAGSPRRAARAARRRRPSARRARGSPRRSRTAAEHERDLGAAVAARLHQRAGDLALVLDRQQPVEPAADAAAGRDRAQRPQQRRQLARPVDALGGALGDVVVGAEQRRHPRRVRRAAGVLEQQRVEEVRAALGVEPDRLREPHPDLARADRVARAVRPR